MQKKYIISCLVFIIMVGQVWAQKIDSTLFKYADVYQQEKIHIHLDKSMYSSGETIWFKGYIMAGIDLSTYSKNFYVDWFDDKGKLLKHTMSPVFESSSSGYFDIPENYTGKFVHAKGYTQWMLNFDTAFLFNKDIRIDQPTTKINAVDTPTTSITFFPEGGDLVNGISSRVAFLATNNFGLPVKVSGAIKNNNGVLIDSFVSEHNGMGSFLLEPIDKEIYTATWVDEYGISKTSTLPIAKKTAATLQVQPTKSKAIFFVTRSKEDITENLKTFYIIAHMHQNVVYKSRINLSEKLSAVGEIDVKDLPTGVLQITLFDANYIPLAERVVFVNNFQFLFTPQVRITKTGLEKRAKNTIEVEVPDAVLTNMSVAITDGALFNDGSSNIVSQLLLSGDIKGYIHNPAYYFTSKADSVFQQLDLVMLTHGWRRFNWKEVVAGQLPFITKPKETDFMQLKGSVFGLNTFGAKQDPTIFLILQAKDSSKQTLMLPVDKQGNFLQKGVMFYDTIKVYHQLTGEKKYTERAEVRYQNGLLQAPTRKFLYTNLSPFLYNFYKNDSLAFARNKVFNTAKDKLNKQVAAALLAEVTVSTRQKSAKEILDEKYTSGLFSGADGISFDVLSDPFGAAAQDVFSYLTGRVAGLQISNSGGQTTLSWRGATPSLFLDEIQQSDAESLRNISMNDVAYIKVLRPPFFGATGGGSGGAIAVYTRKGGDVKVDPGKGLPNQSLAGYTKYKQFYSPNYSTTAGSSLQDIRSTLYWNPYLLTDAKNKTVQIEFYNNDISNSFRLIIEGINADGKLIRVEKIIQ